MFNPRHSGRFYVALGLRGSISGLRSYFRNLKFDTFDAGSRPCRFFRSVTRAERFPCVH